MTVRLNLKIEKFSILFLLFCVACSTTATLEDLKEYKKNPLETHRQLCDGLTKEIKEISGSIWVKVESKNGSGQFPANVFISKDRLTIEITDLLGGTQGVLNIENEKFQYEGKGGDSPLVRSVLKTQQIVGLSPTEFKELFFGKLPCFVPETTADIGFRAKEKTILFYNSKKQSDEFLVKKWGERLLPEIYIRSELRFEFSGFKDPFGLPENLTIHSKSGVANVRWKDRSFETK